MTKTANSVMITLARESRGISQKALAERLGITQAAVSKLENGQLIADSDTLEKLTAVLGYPKSFFCRNFEIYPPGMQFYRKHKTLPGKIARRIEAALNIYRLHVSQLLQSAEIEFTPIPEADVDEYGSATGVACALRQYLRLPRGPIKSVVEILERMGIVVIAFDPGSRLFSGVSTIVNTENYVILLNSRMPGDRFRWTLAHELGHIIMHRLPTEVMEEEADEFAGEFLMPTDEVLPELQNLSIEKLSALKRRWRVSINAIVTHAHKVKAINDWQQRMIRVQLAEHGITRTQEPGELTFPIEQSFLMNELIDFHLNELGYSVNALSDSVGLHANEFLATYNPVLPAITSVPKPKLSLINSR